MIIPHIWENKSHVPNHQPEKHMPCHRLNVHAHRCLHSIAAVRQVIPREAPQHACQVGPRELRWGSLGFWRFYGLCGFLMVFWRLGASENQQKIGIVSGFFWMFMDFHGFSWIFMDFHGFSG